MPSPRLAGCPLRNMHRWQPALGRHWPVSILVEASVWLLLQREQTHLPASQPVSAGGGHPAERAGSGVRVGTLAPIDLSSPRWAPPLQQSAASALPEGLHMPRAEENPTGIFFLTSMNIKD